MIDFIKRKLNITDNSTEIVLAYLALRNIKISPDTVRHELVSHPNHGSLLAIADFFCNQQIENATFTPSIDQLSEDFFPSIVPITSSTGKLTYFSIVKSVNNGQVNFFDPEKHSWQKLDVAEFGTRYQQIVFVAEADHPVIEKDFAHKVRVERRRNIHYLFLFLLLPLALTGRILTTTPVNTTVIFSFIYNLLTYAGLLFSGLLILFEADNNHPVFQKICGGSKKTDCSTILQSNGSSLFGVKYSFIGFCHFTSLLLIAFFFTTEQSVGFLQLVSLLVSPFIIYSLYYQARVAKKWCVNCLLVQAVLFLQALFFLVHQTQLAELTISSVLFYGVPFMLIYLFVYLALYGLLPLLRSAAGEKELKAAYQKAKYQDGVFWHRLTKEQKFDINQETGLSFTKNDGVPINLTIVCSPYCKYCAEAHDHIDKLYEQGKVNLTLLFNSSANPSDERYLPVKHLLYLAGNNDEQFFFKAMQDWYAIGMQDYGKFAARYPFPNDEAMDRLDIKINDMGQWCIQNDVRFTPTAFINGYPLPEFYTIEELRFALS